MTARRLKLIATGVATAAILGLGAAAMASAHSTPDAATQTTPVAIHTTGTRAGSAPAPATVTPVTESATSGATTTSTRTNSSGSTPNSPAGFPSAATTGVPAGWTPRETRSSWRITTPGIYEDVRVNGDITVAAGGVTLRRVEVVGGEIANSACGGAAPLVLEDVTIRPEAGQGWVRSTEGAVHHGNFVARSLKVLDYAEGLRAGDCGPITVEDSYLVINDNNDCELHSDGIQGYGGRGVTVRNTAIDANKMGCGTSPFFYPRDQGNNTPVDIDGLWLAGGGYSFRLGVGPATVRRVQILDRSWGYGPIDVYCSAISAWDVSVVDTAGRTVRSVGCGGSGT